MDRPLESRLDSWPAHIALAVATGLVTTHVPVQRWSRPARWALHGGLGALGAGAMAIGMSQLDAPGAPATRETGPVRPGTATTVAVAVGFGALVAGISRGGQAADAWAEHSLATRGVRRPRLWMGVVAAGASLAMSASDRRRAERQDEPTPGRRDLDGSAPVG